MQTNCNAHRKLHSAIMAQLAGARVCHRQGLAHPLQLGALAGQSTKVQLSTGCLCRTWLGRGC